MTLSRLQPGSKFRIPEATELGVAVLLMVNDCRAIIRWDKAPEYVHYVTESGKDVEFYRACKPESVTPYLRIERVK